MSANPPYITKDVEVAAYLHALDIKIVDVRKNDANKTIFLFEDADGGVNQIALNYYNHDDQISASKLLWSFQQIKSLLFDPNLERLSQTRAKART